VLSSVILWCSSNHIATSGLRNRSFRDQKDTMPPRRTRGPSHSNALRAYARARARSEPFGIRPISHRARGAQALDLAEPPPRTEAGGLSPSARPLPLKVCDKTIKLVNGGIAEYSSYAHLLGGRGIPALHLHLGDGAILGALGKSLRNIPEMGRKASRKEVPGQVGSGARASALIRTTDILLTYGLTQRRV
jgi:hypothetical protein